MDRESIALRLDLIAAKAKQLSQDLKGHGLWNGDLSRGLREIHEQLSAAENEARDDR